MKDKNITFFEILLFYTIYINILFFNKKNIFVINFGLL